jgi:hypothetical protein
MTHYWWIDWNLTVSAIREIQSWHIPSHLISHFNFAFLKCDHQNLSFHWVNVTHLHILCLCHVTTLLKSYVFVHEQIITVYIYPMENSKYTQMRLILTNTVIKNILIILHAIVLFIIIVVSVFQNKWTLPDLLLAHLEENLETWQMSAIELAP